MEGNASFPSILLSLVPTNQYVIHNFVHVLWNPQCMVVRWPPLFIALEFTWYSLMRDAIFRHTVYHAVIFRTMVFCKYCVSFSTKSTLDWIHTLLVLMVFLILHSLQNKYSNIASFFTLCSRACVSICNFPQPFITAVDFYSWYPVTYYTRELHSLKIFRSSYFLFITGRWWSTGWKLYCYVTYLGLVRYIDRTQIS